MTIIDDIWNALRQIKDPELHINIVDLGLIYNIEIEKDGHVDIEMTLTSPGCPVGPEILKDVDQAVRQLEGINNVYINLVWEPYWTSDRINPVIRTLLNY